AAREVLEVADVVELLEERLEGVRGLRILEVVVAQAGGRLGQAVGKPVEQVALACRPRPVLERVERVALEVEEPLELVADLAEGVAEVHLPVARAHLLAELLEEVV